MKTQKHKILTAAIAAAVLSGASAMAQLNYNNGDMLAGFYTAGATNEVIVNLGSIATFQNQYTSASYNLGAVLNSTFGSSAAGISWTIFGINDTTVPYNSSVSQANANTLWASLAWLSPSAQGAAPHVSGNATSQGNVVSDVNSIVNAADPGQNPANTVNNFASGIAVVRTSNQGIQYWMYNGGAFSGNFGGDFGWDTVNTGVGNSELYQSDPGVHARDYATAIGAFSLDAGGVLSYNPVPEPSTWAMLGSGALALLALRRRK
ncbi:MAG: PEP-CTERM sorting domain-containing protein [Verrucomicrobiota bacterium]